MVTQAEGELEGVRVGETLKLPLPVWDWEGEEVTLRLGESVLEALEEVVVEKEEEGVELTQNVEVGVAMKEVGATDPLPDTLKVRVAVGLRVSEPELERERVRDLEIVCVTVLEEEREEEEQELEVRAPEGEGARAVALRHRVGLRVPDTELLPVPLSLTLPVPLPPPLLEAGTAAMEGVAAGLDIVCVRLGERETEFEVVRVAVKHGDLLWVVVMEFEALPE